MLARIFLTAVLIFLGFRFLYFLHKKLKYPEKIKHHVGYSLSVFELINWIAFVIWCVQYVYESKNYFGLVSFGIIFILLIVPTYFLLRDFLTGVYLKFQNLIQVGSIIDFEGITGTIDKVGHFSLELINKHGDIQTVPFNKIKSGIISRQGNNPNLKKVELEFSFADSYSINNLLTNLRKQLLNTPWVAASEWPIIESVNHKNGKHIINVSVFTLKEGYANNIKEMVETNFVS